MRYFPKETKRTEKRVSFSFLPFNFKRQRMKKLCVCLLKLKGGERMKKELTDRQRERKSGKNKIFF